MSYLFNCTEAWVLAAHDIETAYHAPPDKPLECVNKPDMIISNQRDYQQLIPIVLDNWEEVKHICKQAAKFENDVKAIVERIYHN